jgi:hypothetical protein
MPTAHWQQEKHRSGGAQQRERAKGVTLWFVLAAGHGVGAALNVHEGPQSISTRYWITTPLQVGTRMELRNIAVAVTCMCMRVWPLLACFLTVSSNAAFL